MATRSLEYIPQQWQGWVATLAPPPLFKPFQVADMSISVEIIKGKYGCLHEIETAAEMIVHLTRLISHMNSPGETQVARLGFHEVTHE